MDLVLPLAWGRRVLTGTSFVRWGKYQERIFIEKGGGDTGSKG